MRMKFLHIKYKMDFRKWSLSLTLLSLFLTAIPMQAENHIPAEKISIEEAFTLIRSEEHTSELQSRGHLVCRLLLEKKKINKHIKQENTTTQNANTQETQTNSPQSR